MIKNLEKTSLYTNKILLKRDWSFSTTGSTYYNEDIKILDGENIHGTFYPTESRYHSDFLEPKNKDGSYKRVIYNQDKISFYIDGLYKFQYPDINLSLGESIRSIRLSRKISGERIIPESVKIEDYSNGQFKLVLVDDGQGNLINPNLGSVKSFSKNIPVNNVSYRIPTEVTYFDLNGNQISKESAIETYKNGGEVKEELTYETISGESPIYDPLNERYGYSIDSSGEYLIASSICDDDSFSLSRNGKVILNKRVSGTDYRAIKIFQSPFQSAWSLESSYEDFFSNEYGDFILHEESGYLCASQSYYKDNFGQSVAINGSFCAISSPFTRKCLQLCETGSGLVYCYQRDKGGFDNWGMISVLEGETSEDYFGYSISIKNDVLVVGAPKYSGSIGAVYIFRKKRYQSSNKTLYTPTASVGYDVLLTDVTSSLLSASVDSEYKNIKTQTFNRSFWTPLSQICFEVVTSNIFEPIESDINFLSEDELLISDGQDTSKYFGPFDLVPNYVKNDYMWKLETKIVGDHVGDEFGGSVSTGDNVIVVGNSNPSGSQLAWVYSCSSSLDSDGYPEYTWQKETTLNISDGDGVSEIPTEFDIRSLNSGFGHSVSIDGEYIYVGAPYERLLNGAFVGSAVIYRRYSGRDYCGNYALVTTPIKKVSSYLYTEKNSLFGYSGEIKDKNLIISAPYSHNISNLIKYEENKFSVDDIDISGTFDSSFFSYALEGNEVSRLAQISLKKSIGDPSSFFGKDVSISGNNFFVGNPIFTKPEQTSSIDKFVSQSVISNASNWAESHCSKLSGSVFVYELSSEPEHVGNVFYSAGQIIITSQNSIYKNTMGESGSLGYNLRYSSEEKSYSSEIIVPISPGEFNASTNPTALYGRKLLLDVNSDGLFDFRDISLIMKYINGDSVESDFDPEGYMEIESSDHSWWKNDLILTESEDAIIAQGMAGSKNLDSYTQEISDAIKTKYIDTLLLDINGDGVVDEKDGSLLWNYWIGKIDVDVVNQNVSTNSSRSSLDEIISYINVLLGKLSPYPSKKNANGGVYNSGNGGSVKENILTYVTSSLSDPTGSYLSTYITSIGLYSGGDLVMVGKLGTPVKNIIEYPINLSIKFELF